MWSCTLGLKKYMTTTGTFKGLKYKKHKPGVRI